MTTHYTLRSGFLTRGEAQAYANTLPPEAKAKVNPYRPPRRYVQPLRYINSTLFAVNVCRCFIPEEDER